MRLSIFLFFLLSAYARAQDTTHIYFHTGSSRIRDAYMSSIHRLRIDTTSADSIHFIGFADSTGNSAGNERLSLKRARRVCEQLAARLPEQLTFRVIAKGESAKGTDSLNRRVDIVIFYPVDGTNPNSAENAEITIVDSNCYFVDQTAMSLVHARVIEVKRKEAVFLETEAFAYFELQRLFCVKGIDEKGQAILQRVKWQRKTTGAFWWKKERLVATVPKYGFDRSFLVFIEKPPCDDCTKRQLGKDSVILTKYFFCKDVFLMRNVQVKVRFFGNGQVRFRAPKEYVNTERHYSSTGGAVSWETRKGKKHQPYYYTTLRLSSSEIPAIGFTGSTSRCARVKALPGGGAGLLRCRGVYGGFGLNLKLAVEPGAFYHNDTLTGFLTAGFLFNSDRLVTTMQAGINSHGGFYGSARSQFHFFRFPFRSLNFSGWHATAGEEPILTYGTLFTGLEVKQSYNKHYLSFSEVNVHLGLLRVNVRNSALVPRIYVYGGLARDFSNHINQHFYPFVQAGLMIRIENIRIWR